MPASVMLEIPLEVCVPPTTIRSEPWPKAPTLSWDLDTVHAAREEFAETSLDLKAPPSLSPGPIGGCPQPARPPLHPGPAGWLRGDWRNRLQEPLPSHLPSVFAWTQDEEFLLSGGLWHLVLLFSLF